MLSRVEAWAALIKAVYEVDPLKMPDRAKTIIISALLAPIAPLSTRTAFNTRIDNFTPEATLPGDFNFKFSYIFDSSAFSGAFALTTLIFFSNSDTYQNWYENTVPHPWGGSGATYFGEGNPSRTAHGARSERTKTLYGHTWYIR